jgi:hypothetical protein
VLCMTCTLCSFAPACNFFHKLEYSYWLECVHSETVLPEARNCSRHAEMLNCLVMHTTNEAIDRTLLQHFSHISAIIIILELFIYSSEFHYFRTVHIFQ